jgi:hypothetical protein
VADPPIGFLAKKATRRGGDDFGGMLQVEFRLGAGELVGDDRREPFLVATAVGEAFSGCALAQAL